MVYDINMNSTHRLPCGVHCHQNYETKAQNDHEYVCRTVH